MVFILIPPTIVGDLDNPKSGDGLGHLFPFADQDVGLPQFVDDLLGTATFCYMSVSSPKLV